MSALSRWSRIAAILPVVLLAGRTAFAQEETEADPPDRVARLSYVQGDVSLAAAENGERERAELNRPLTSGDEIDVGDRARAELQVDVASLHIGERSSISLLALDDQTLALRLIDGEAVIHVRELREGDRIEVETANARVSLMEPGEYRLAVENGGETTVVGVREGGTEIESGQQVFSLHASQEGRYTGTSSLQEDVRSLGPRNELEAWAEKRESRDYESSPSSRYVSRDVIGYRDLDEYGVWETDSYYGSVWYPRRISAGWAPYRFGQWAYIGPWGWTWIDQAPWGFAPFHYGRWAYLRSRWCWVPGPRHVRPVYAPALVGWVPRGGGYAWFPLGPREVYVPRYRASDRYVRQVNVTNTTIVNVDHITNVYRGRAQPGRYMNERAADHVAALPRQTFTAARPPAPAARYISRGDSTELRSAAARPTYQPPRLQASPNRDAAPRVTTPRNTTITTNREAPRETREARESRERKEISRPSIPARTVPNGTLPSRTIPRYTPPSSSSQSAGRTVTIPPARTVSPPPTRSYTPPARVMERQPPRSTAIPERRASPPSPPPQSQRNTTRIDQNRR